MASQDRGTAHSRPLSPHLQVYKPQITSIMSISHRITGIALSVGAIFLTAWLVAAAHGPETFAAVQWFFGSFLGYLMLFGWTAALFYHMANGIRHLAWDMGYGFDLPDVEKSGAAVFVFTGGATVLVWLLGLIL